MPYFLVFVAHVRTSQAYGCAYAYRTSGNQALVLMFVVFVDEGVYVNTNGDLVRHAMLQWGETPYAIGKFENYFLTNGSPAN